MRLSFLTFLCLAIIFQSCSSTSDVAQEGLFQKRKYRKGLHGNFGKTKVDKKKSSNIDNEEVAEFLEIKANFKKPMSNQDSLSSFENKWWAKSPSEETNELKKDSLNSNYQASYGLKNTQRSWLEHRLMNPVIGSKHQSVLANKIRKRFAYQDDPASKAETQGIVSIVLAGLVFLIIGGLPILNIAASIAAIILGNKAREGGEETLGLIGFILGIAALVFSIFATLLIVGYIILIVSLGLI